jgi:hypothetical protein
MAGTVFSPRLGVVYTPRTGHRLRASYNRAFSTPTSTDLFVDIVAAQLGPLPYSIRAVGVPKGGFHFATDCATHNVLAVCGGTAFSLDATVLWPAVAQIIQANGVDLSALPADQRTRKPSCARSIVGRRIPHHVRSTSRHRTAGANHQ